MSDTALLKSSYIEVRKQPAASPCAFTPDLAEHAV
jgi:hypothetical protein